jgi:hypothetical protein
VHTSSVVGGTSQLNCICLAGYGCSYTKRITATVTLNNTNVENFNTDIGGVKSSFLAAIAAAAGVPVNQITIISVGAHGGGRRLLQAGGLRTVGMLKEGVRVRFQIKGVPPSVDVHTSLMRALAS